MLRVADETERTRLGVASLSIDDAGRRLFAAWNEDGGVKTVCSKSDCDESRYNARER